MTTISIRPATVADADSISNVLMEAQEPLHEFYELFFQKHPRELSPIAVRQAVEKTDRFTFFVAEEESGVASSRQVVGFVRYMMIEAATETAEAEAQPVPTASSIWTPREHMKELWEQFNSRQDRAEALTEKALRGRRHILVQQVMVLPGHQRKGLGRKLLQKALDEADAQGVPSILTSSEMGYGLYLRMGFEILDGFSVNNGEWTVKILDHLKNLGMSRDETLVEKYKGTVENEWAMIRDLEK